MYIYIYICVKSSLHWNVPTHYALFNELILSSIMNLLQFCIYELHVLTALMQAFAKMFNLLRLSVTVLQFMHITLYIYFSTGLKAVERAYELIEGRKYGVATIVRSLKNVFVSWNAYKNIVEDRPYNLVDNWL